MEDLIVLVFIIGFFTFVFALAFGGPMLMDWADDRRAGVPELRRELSERRAQLTAREQELAALRAEHLQLQSDVKRLARTACAVDQIALQGMLNEPVGERQQRKDTA